jgi:hypothetical protein
MSKLDIDKIECATLNVLKDFQRATVNRIDNLFRQGQRRVLVADEVGMGKTLIARGVIVKTTRLRIEEGDDLFKVVYICSNQNIARQNIRKLDITGGTAVDTEDTRLSMQHLKIALQENDEVVKEGYIQMIPLTPDTSFRMTAGGGNVNERALMFAVLSRMNEFCDCLDTLEQLMILDAQKAWSDYIQLYVSRVVDCEEKSEGKYPANIIAAIRQYEDFTEIVEQLKQYFRAINNSENPERSRYFLVNRLRTMFARISVAQMQPDLVIMDEFQRFKSLLSEDDSEMGILAKKFLSGEETRTLLLSATPYKLYSTMDEIGEAQMDEHYAEFFQVMDFLFNGNHREFHTVWKNYSVALNEITSDDASIVQVKNQAQNAMYQGVCRTERISVMDSGDYTDDSSVKEPLNITENDILSYIQMGQVLEAADAKYSLPVDYVKSCPFLMSFMRNYKLKENLNKYFFNHPEEVYQADKKLLWVNKNKISNYDALPETNARLSELIDKSIGNKGEMLLWVPPSRPYYTLQGVYKESDGFSKVLVFSAWEMVPRMIGSLVSYEAERKTVGRLSKQARNQDRKNAYYFVDGSRRFPVARLRFNRSNGEVHSMSLFALLYPSKTLSALYHPIKAMNDKLSLNQIEGQIRRALKLLISQIENKYPGDKSGNADAKWYYLATMLLDGKDYVNQWIRDITDQMQLDDETFQEKGNKGFLAHIEQLKLYLSNIEQTGLGKQPDDLIETLINIVLGSPAVCVYRANGNNEARASELAKVFINNFNLPEATAIVDLAYGRCRDDNSHWQNVIRYCKDGCFQSMFDEYYHLLSDTVGIGCDKERDEEIHGMMMESLRIRTSTYMVDTFQAFKKRANGEKGEGTQGIRIRSSYAVGFTKDAGGDTKQVNRKESVRNAFNSPMRPFVLATTSIGQEGLDFHNYCRKIMHWNLPSNPIDLEQREGRINRFKCLAIRQNVAQQYGDIEFQTDIWKEMFKAAEIGEKQDGQSELVPYWCFGKNQSVKIERIVPMYPISKDEVNYERLIKILSLYRLTLGQARQEELLDYLFKEFDDIEELKKLFIDLSPYSRTKEQ